LQPFLVALLLGCTDPNDDPPLPPVTTDADGDGFDTVASGGSDCDDTDAAVYPGATEVWYDGIDQDCVGDDDFDQDADGFALEADCDDEDPAIHPDATEIWYDGIDQDCAGDDDFDQDADGFALVVDCDDADPAIRPDATEVWYDGIDQDCAGDDDFDQDGDGVAVDAECDDTDPTATLPQIVMVPADVPTLQQALDGVCDGGEVHLAAGLYVGGVTIDRPLTLIGEGPDVTVLDGDASERVVTATEPLTVSGVRIQNGDAGFWDGGGLSMRGGILSDVVVTGNRASYRGGGIHSVGPLELDDVEVSFNFLTSTSSGLAGGGIYGDALEMNDVRLLNNGARIGGGVSAENIRMTDSVVSFNSSSEVGAVEDRGNGFVATRTVFEGNSSAGVGTVSASDAELDDCVVVDNWYGGAAFAGNLVARSTLFAGNDALYARGSAVRVQGTSELENCIVIDNAPDGAVAALDAATGDLTLRNVTIVGNGGTGIALDRAPVDMTNTIVSGHDDVGVDASRFALPTMAYSNLFGNRLDVFGIDPPTGFDGMISVDPGFVLYDPALPWTEWDLHLRPGSPLRDAGDPTVLDPDGTASDIGAHGGPGADFAYYEDADSDGLYDGWELRFGLDPAIDDAQTDVDGDGLTAREELAAGTRPDLADADGDLVNDGDELAAGTPPLARPRHLVVVVDITSSWSSYEFGYVQDTLRALLDQVAFGANPGDRLGVVAFYGRYGIEYLPLVDPSDAALADQVELAFDLLSQTSLVDDCPDGPRCLPWMPTEYADEYGTDPAIGLQVASSMFADLPTVGVERSVFLFTDGRLADVGPHEIRLPSEEETRWHLEKAESSRAVPEIEVAMVAEADRLHDDHAASIWLVSTSTLPNVSRGEGRWYSISPAFVDEMVERILPLVRAVF